MTWGNTAYTPIVTYNQPPFGFHEVQHPPDFPRCFGNPYKNTYVYKNSLDKMFKKRFGTRYKGSAEEPASGNVQLIEGFSNTSDLCKYLKCGLWLILLIMITKVYLD